MNRTFLSLVMIFGTLLILSTVHIAEAIPNDKKSQGLDFVHTKASFQKQSIDANKQYTKSIMSIQTDYDRAKSYAKQVYEYNSLKANGDSQKQSNAKYTYNEMLSIAKTDFIKSFNDAKNTYNDKLNKIKIAYSNPN